MTFVPQYVGACDPAIPACVPLQVPFFDDWSSYWHALVGFLMSFEVTAPVAAIVALGYIFYQMRETEPLPNKVGDFAEFAAGFLAGFVIPHHHRVALEKWMVA